SMIMIGGGPAYKGPRKPMLLRVLVPNADDVYQSALSAGAVSTLEMTENYGERFGCAKDPFDNQWIISTQIGPAYSEGLHHSVTTFIKVKEAARMIAFMQRALGASELMRAGGAHEKVRHVVIKIGDSVLGISDARDESFPPQLHLYVPDVDGWYDRAVRAG